MSENKKPTEADLEFFHKWLHDAAQQGEGHAEDDTPEGGDARTLRVGSYLLGYYDGIQNIENAMGR